VTGTYGWPATLRLQGEDGPDLANKVILPQWTKAEPAHNVFCCSHELRSQVVLVECLNSNGQALAQHRLKAVLSV
jgi:hypothetical protein